MAPAKSEPIDVDLFDSLGKNAENPMMIDDDEPSSSQGPSMTRRPSQIQLGKRPAKSAGPPQTKRNKMIPHSPGSSRTPEPSGTRRGSTFKLLPDSFDPDTSHSGRYRNARRETVVLRPGETRRFINTKANPISLEGSDPPSDSGSIQHIPRRRHAPRVQRNGQTRRNTRPNPVANGDDSDDFTPLERNGYTLGLNGELDHFAAFGDHGMEVDDATMESVHGEDSSGETFELDESDSDSHILLDKDTIQVPFAEINKMMNQLTLEPERNIASILTRRRSSETGLKHQATDAEEQRHDIIQARISNESPLVWQWLSLADAESRSPDAKYRKHHYHSTIPAANHGPHTRISDRDVLQPTFPIIHQSAGCINKIIQYQGNIAVASLPIQGQADEDGERINDYNIDGNLWELRAGSHAAVPISFHSCIKPGGWAGTHTKYFNVNDVKYDFNGTLVSTGSDGKLYTSVYNDVESVHKKVYYYSGYEAEPIDIAFDPQPPDPENARMAIGEKNISVHENSRGQLLGQLQLVPEESRYRCGPLVWGKGETAGMLFASSEIPDDDLPDGQDYNGHHVQFDVETGTSSVLRCSDDEGDALAISTDGCKLALCSRRLTGNQLSILRLNQNEAMTTLEQPDFAYQRVMRTAYGHELLQTTTEVNCATFSSDDIYLALARGDNQTLVYDMRMIERGPLHWFAHTGEPRVSPGCKHSFGIVNAQWISRRNGCLSLVTGGDDGTVRLWDPSISSYDEDNGIVIAETMADVAHFSIGDRFKGEHELVVGDGDGRVYIFNGTHVPLI